jgi:predicted glycoside hydrolase/deacetylase ChbG (UPF0249 family)
VNEVTVTTKRKDFAAGKDLDYYRDMIQLIVNADDLGINTERDRGIFQAFTDGIVTCATMLANGSSFEAAAEQVKQVALPVGVHLNLSEGITLTGPIYGLTDQQGRLSGKIKMRQYLIGDQVDLIGIRREFSAQIQKTLDTGLNPDHLDGHQHCHAYPHLTEIVADLAREYRINALRSVCPAHADDTDIPDDLADDIAFFQDIGCKASDAWQASGIKTTQGLWGLPHLNNLDTKVLCELLETIPDGHWELMTHPGYPNPEGRHFESSQRFTELTALCSTQVKEIIYRRNIRLATFGELPCVS